MISNTDTGTTIVVAYVVVPDNMVTNCTNGACDNYADKCLPYIEPRDPADQNGNLHYLWRPSPARLWKPVARLNRKSQPRWRAGRWKSKTHRGRQV